MKIIIYVILFIAIFLILLKSKLYEKLNDKILFIISLKKMSKLMDYFYKTMTAEEYEGAKKQVEIGFGLRVLKDEQGKHTIIKDNRFLKEIKEKYSKYTN